MRIRLVMDTHKIAIVANTFLWKQFRHMLSPRSQDLEVLQECTWTHFVDWTIVGLLYKQTHNLDARIVCSVILCDNVLIPKWSVRRCSTYRSLSTFKLLSFHRHYLEMRAWRLDGDWDGCAVSTKEGYIISVFDKNAKSLYEIALDLGSNRD